MTEPKDFYSPGEITFKRPEVIWLLNNFELLLDGVWPSDHKESGYTGGKGKHGHSAPFENPELIMAELVIRLDQVGRDALPLLIAYSKDLEQQYYIRDFLARCLRIDVIELEKRIDNALRFISGWKRKERNYRQFCQHKRGDK